MINFQLGKDFLYFERFYDGIIVLGVDVKDCLQLCSECVCRCLACEIVSINKEELHMLAHNVTFDFTLDANKLISTWNRDLFLHIRFFNRYIEEGFRDQIFQTITIENQVNDTLANPIDVVYRICINGDLW